MQLLTIGMAVAFNVCFNDDDDDDCDGGNNNDDKLLESIRCVVDRAS